jgi:Holliday junction resolvase RusA-like endonuclease
VLANWQGRAAPVIAAARALEAEEAPDTWERHRARIPVWYTGRVMQSDFVIWGVPVSHQANGQAVRRWRERVAIAAREAIPEEDCVLSSDLSLPLVFFHAGEAPADLDNIAKSTLDGMNAIVFGDDRQIAQLVLRRTCLDEPGLSIESSTPALTTALEQAIDEQRDFVYVRLDPPPDHRRLP